MRLRDNVGGDQAKVIYSGASASFEGSLDHISYRARLNISASGGSVTTSDSCIIVNNANSLLLVLAGATNFDQHSPDYLSDADAMRDDVDSRSANAIARGWQLLLQRHLNDYIPICNRMSMTLDGAESTLPTDRLVDRYTQTGFRLSEALMLEELYFHYGRYLLIASSRGEDTPANLQGIWNHTATPPWKVTYIAISTSR